MSSAPFPTLLVSRRRRQVDVDWTGARSWLGGAPRIGATAWPRDDKREPLHFVAQIDLAEVAAKTGRMPLPDKGSLAFFIGREGAVVFAPEGRAETPVMPPAGTPDLVEYGSKSDWRTDLAGRPLFPYWPVDIAVLNVPPPPPSDDDEDGVMAFRAAQVAAVEKLFPRRECNLDPEQAFAGPPVPGWWQTAIHYANYLEKAVREIPSRFAFEQTPLDINRKKVETARSENSSELKTLEGYVAMYERNIARLQQLQPALLLFAVEVSALSKGRDPWALMTPADTARLASLWERNRDFAAFHGNQGDFPLDYLKTEMFKALPKAGTPEFSALPAPVRKLIDEKRTPRPQWWFMGVHFAKRLQEAAVHDVQGATKWRQDDIDKCRTRIAELRPQDPLAVFRRFLGPKESNKNADKIAEMIKGMEEAIAKREAQIEGLRRLEPSFRQFVKETIAWAQGRDPWSLMQPADIEHLNAQMKRMREEFKDFDASMPHNYQSLESSTLVVMASADDRGYAALPEPVRQVINRDFVLPAGGWHQMFGRGIEIQGDSCAMREEGYIMLMQLTYDDLMHWSFGDNGCYQFWISPADLAKRNWAAAKMTFECH